MHRFRPNQCGKMVEVLDRVVEVLDDVVVVVLMVVVEVGKLVQ